MAIKGYDPNRAYLLGLLNNEEQNQLEKVARFVDPNDVLLSEYKIFPAGKVGDACLERLFFYTNGVITGEQVNVETWTQTMEDLANPAGAVPTDIILSNNIVQDGDLSGTVVGDLSSVGGISPFVFTIINDPDNKFQIVGNQLQLLSEAEVSESPYDVTIRVTDGDSNTFDKSFQIVVEGVSVFSNDNATQFQGNTVDTYMSGPASNSILPGNGSLTASAWVKKDNPIFLNEKAIEFDGVNGYMSLANPSNFHFNDGLNDTAFSISAWINMVDATQFRIATKGTNTSRELIFTVTASDQLAILLYTNASSDNIFIRSNDTLTSDQGSWIHVACTYDGSETAAGLKLYRNGVEMAITDASTGTYSGVRDSGNNMLIGRFQAAGGEYADGDIDELSFFNQELNATQIDGLYNSGAPLDISTTPGIFSWYRMGDGDVAPTITDQVGSNNGTLFGGASIVNSTLTGSQPPSVTFPDEISGLELWYDIDDNTTITESGGFVSQVDDKSGNANHLTAPAAANEPALTANGFGSRQVLTLDGTDDYMTATTGNNYSEVTVFLVAKFNQLNQPAADFDYIYSLGNNSANNMISLSRRAAGAQADDYYLYTGTTTLDGPDLVGQTWQVFTQRINNAATYHEFFINGASQTVTDNGTSFSLNGNFELGRFLTGTHYLDGDIGEIIIYNSALSNTDREAIEEYLTEKWVNGEDVSGFKNLITVGQNASENNKIALQWNESNKLRVSYYNTVSGLVEEIESEDNWGDNSYHLVNATYDSIAQEVKLYVDNDLKGTASAILPTTGTELSYIATDANLSTFYDGLMDEVSLWSDVVDISLLYADGFATDLAEHPDAANLRLWLRMGDPADDYLTSEGVLDRSGNGFNYTAVNMSNSNIVTDSVPTGITNTFSTSFNGVSQYVNCGTPSILDFDNTDPFSFSLWVKRDAISGSDMFLAKTNTTNNIGYIAYFDTNANNRLLFNLNNSGAQQIRTRTTLGAGTIGAWNHISITYDGSSTAAGVTVYLNGVSQTVQILEDTLASTTISTQPFVLGAESDGGNPFLGNLDEVAVFDKELSSAEVLEVYNSGAIKDLSQLSFSANLILWYRMGDGDTFPNIADQVGSFNAIMINMTAANFDTDVP